MLKVRQRGIGRYQSALHAQAVGQVVQRPATPACTPRSCPPSTCRWAFRPRTAPQAETTRCRRDCEFGDSAMESLLSKSMTFEKRPRRAQARPQDEKAKLRVFPFQERTRLSERHTREPSGQCRKGEMTSLAAPWHEEEGIRCQGFSSASIADANRCTTANRRRAAHPPSIIAP